MHFLLSCWFWFARRARRRATGRSAAQAGRFATAAQRRARAVAATSIARRSALARSSGAGTGAPCRNGRRRRERSLQGGAMPAASVQAFQRDEMVADRAAEQAKPSRAVSRERPAMRTGPQGAKRPEPQGDQRERARRPAATAPSAATAVVWRKRRSGCLGWVARDLNRGRSSRGYDAGTQAAIAGARAPSGTFAFHLLGRSGPRSS